MFYIFPRYLSGKKPGDAAMRVTIGGAVTISDFNPTAVNQAKGIYLFAIPVALHGQLDREPDGKWFTQDVKGF